MSNISIFSPASGSNEPEPPLRDRLQLRLLSPTAKRSITSCLDGAIIMATDIGRDRADNQDRLVTVCIADPLDRGQSCTIVALADGMGGMCDGGQCASIAITAFVTAMLEHRAVTTRARAQLAIEAANAEVFSFAKGRGGTTLSAAIFPSSGPAIVVNIGDSRIYAVDPGRCERLTTDDTVAELIGGDDQSLTAFVGMERALERGAELLSTELPMLLLTSDGLHFVPHKALSAAIDAAPAKTATNLLDLAYHFGAPDNASCILVRIPRLSQIPK